MGGDLTQGRTRHPAWSRPRHLACHAAHARGRRADGRAACVTRPDDARAGEEVVRLDAPEWPRVPDTLRRANGESIYRPHATELYATRTQLSLEQQLLADAQADTAPHLTPETAALLLGADLTQLETQLSAQFPAPETTRGAGLRLDQATAAFLALTSPRRVELIVGPAGTGKTYTAVHIAQAWRNGGMGKVYGIATTSAGRNVMLEAGIPLAENTAQFLGHLPGQRWPTSTASTSATSPTASSWPAAAPTKPKHPGHPDTSPKNSAPPAARNNSAASKPPATPTKPPTQPATATTTRPPCIRKHRHHGQRSANAPAKSGRN